MSEGSYQGLRVIDFTHVIAGPFCTRLLADHGADVIKVEPFEGDLMRALPVRFADDLSSAFAQYNCGKRSIALDLKTAAGRAVARRMCEHADVVVENFTPGTFARLVGEYRDLAETNPSLVLCSISSFGQVGPYSHLPGFGVVAEAYSGLMALAADEDGRPTHFGTPLADMNVGVHAFGAIGAALFRRERSGRGTHVDIASFDAMVSMIDEALAMHAVSAGHREFPAYSRRHPAAVPSAIVRAADGTWATYGAPSDAFFRRLAEAIGRPELADDDRFATNDARVAHQDELYEIVDTWASQMPTADSIVEQLAATGMPAARIRHYGEIASDQHLVTRGTLAPVELEGIGRVLLQTAPHRLDGARTVPGGPPPHLGEHTLEILTEAGLDADEIRDLLENNAARARSAPAP